MPEILQSRYDQLLRRVCDLKGPGSKVNDSLTELFPMIDVENLPPELFFLSGTKLSYGGAFVSGVAAETAKVQLFNPAGSGKLITITSVALRLSVASLVRFTAESSARTTATNAERFRDTRGGILPQPSGQVRTSSEAALVPQIGLLFVGTSNLLFNPPNGIAVLRPDTGFVFSPDTVNISLMCTYFWHEREAEPSELNL